MHGRRECVVQDVASGASKSINIPPVENSFSPCMKNGNVQSNFK